ncbi:hypothetical protein DFP72DRAFT_863881 [Ephemerocybe angulata]|uniref:Uncharacterized protein n=1 Tax=Ephemerocybe angulata TaxID=980116 RepID=A0A8H6H5P8_9AGAR|nr:hypothetical protein DFP72DRAFT_863881 [Tulosesus angulatus]
MPANEAIQVIGRLHRQRTTNRVRAQCNPQPLTRLERQEARDQRSFTHRAKTTVPPPLQIPDEDAFLGFALIDIVSPNDGGDGPSLILSDYQRPLSQKQVRKLEEIAGSDGARLLPLSFDNAVYIAVDPSSLLEAQELSKALYGPYSRVTWAPRARRMEMVLLAGAHRQRVAENLTQAQRKAIAALEQKLEALDQVRKPNEAAQIRADIDLLLLAVRPKCIWLAMLYNKETILAVRRNSATALLKLLTNNKIGPSPDSEEHTLSNVFQLAYDAIGADGVPNLLTYAGSLAAKHQKAFMYLLNHGSDFLDFVIRTRVSRHFRHFFTNSQKILDVQLELWGLISPLIKFMWKQLIFVASSVELPEKNPLTQRGYPTLLAQAIMDNDQASITSPIVLDLLVEAADDAFNDQLVDISDQLGTGAEDFENAFPVYIARLETRFRELSESSQLDQPNLWTPEAIGILQSAFPKLRAVLADQAPFDGDGSPNLEGPIPLFSPMCGAALLDDWLGVREVVYMVSLCLRLEQPLVLTQLRQISNVFTPGLSYARHMSKAAKSPAHVPLKSYPDALRLFLEHWIGCDQVGPWSSHSASDVLDTLQVEGESGRTLVETTFHMVVRDLWSHREDILRPALALMNPITRPDSRPDDDSDAFTAAFKTAATKFMNAWLTHAARVSRCDKKDVEPRFCHRLPPEVEAAIEVWEQENEEHRMLPAFRALQFSPFNYLVSPAGASNNGSHHANSVIHAHRELQYFQGYFQDFIALVHPFGLYLSHLFEMVKECPRLGDAPQWLNLPLAGPLQTLQASQYPEVLARKDRDARGAILKQAFGAFVKRISSKGCLGVVSSEDPEEVGLHLGMKASLDTVWEQALYLNHHLAVVGHTEPDDSWPRVEPNWRGPTQPDPSQAIRPRVTFCTFEDLQELYQDTDEDDSDKDNDFIAEDAVDQHFGTLRSTKRLRDRSPSPPSKRPRDASPTRESSPQTSAASPFGSQEEGVSG